ncbi:transposase [Butyrivibrio sp. AC2005]|uniref:transposase n=2 Tax=unclassified Butyrivibrio TaxID=2639466 RepID=UPI0004245224|nr:transposase [Butyrivibrio sp. AC2005]
MLPVNCGSHADYQNFVVENLRKYYPDPDAISQSTWDIIDRFWNLDLSYTDQNMISKYSKFGPAPRTPSCMHRSYLLSIDFKVDSITEWVSQLKINPLYAILSGFEVGDTPGIGTFYDFFSRLWDSNDNNLSSHLHKLKATVKKPGKKGSKAKPIDKVTVDELFKQLEGTTFSIKDQPYGSLFELFMKEFLENSVRKGLINSSNLSIAGDGTPVVTSARERKHRICECAEKGITDCDCERYFSQPDCDIGWDSSRDCFYHGYDLYMIVASDSESDLPVFPLLNPASMHDSHGFLHSFFRMKSFLPDYNVRKLLLDSAHDAMPYYEYCKKEHITPFIDLNEKRGIKVQYKNDFTIGKDGVPVCKAGRKMNHDGVEISKYRIKFRCPLASRKFGCSCSEPCSNSKYGRTVHLAMKDNPRLINIPPRDSDEWKNEYNARTSVERSNKREKIDFKLESGRHRSTKMWYCRLYHILMLQHLDAWDLPYESALRKLVCNVA